MRINLSDEGFMKIKRRIMYTLYYISYTLELALLRLNHKEPSGSLIPNEIKYQQSHGYSVLCRRSSYNWCTLMTSHIQILGSKHS